MDGFVTRIVSSVAQPHAIITSITLRYLRRRKPLPSSIRSEGNRKMTAAVGAQRRMQAMW